MMTDIKNLIDNVSAKMLDNGTRCGLVSDMPHNYPNAEVIFGMIKKLRAVIFWGYFEDVMSNISNECQMNSMLYDIYENLSTQIKAANAMNNGCHDEDAAFANEIAVSFFEELGTIQQLLFHDAEACLDGDPAAKSIDEVILSYPGLFAIFIYRIAHVLYRKNVPFIPRLMSEYAHGKTGIDIHPGAEIGEYFFIDHGTGVVIGETTVVGNRVKLYQGVTLGALSTKNAQQLAGQKRHPTIENNVTIYSGATILGGETVIGENSVIGGNVFITQSILPNTKVKTSV